MNGQQVKHLMASHGMSLDEQHYSNHGTYQLKDIPCIYIDRQSLEQKMIEKYGEPAGKR
jgi:hypothetical protein